MTNLSLTDSNSDTDTCRSLNMYPRAKPPTPNYPYGNQHKDFDGEYILCLSVDEYKIQQCRCVRQRRG